MILRVIIYILLFLFVSELTNHSIVFRLSNMYTLQEKYCNVEDYKLVKLLFAHTRFCVFVSICKNFKH